MAFGLPIAVAVGWTLAGPPKRPSAAASLPSGAGGIGSAPGRTGTDQPVTGVRYQARPNRSASPSALVPGTLLPTLPNLAPNSSAPAVMPTTESTPTGSADPFPPLTAPPVPTPTEVTSVPTESASVSASVSAEPSMEPSARP